MIKLVDVKTGCGVKALCFHHKKPWILAGHTTGMIQLWNYNTNTLLKEFEGHNGSVQSVDFHISCQLFVSAGCDGKIKVWEYCDETNDIITSTTVLEGHEASVNDARFHLQLPWIVSASNDHTVRLWNWKSCCCIAVLSEHTGAVTSSSFHPTRDLVLSSSLDRTLCVWNIGGLRDDRKIHGFEFFFNKLSKKRTGARLRNVLEGHKSGVVHAVFHPTLPIIFSSSDDSSVFWWKIEGKGRRSYHHQPLHPQTTGISPLAYSAKMNAVMYSRDNESVFLYDATSSVPGRKSFGLYIHQKNLLSLCSHPTKDLFAVGHAKGMNIRRMMKEPPGFSVTKYNIYYVSGKYLGSYSFSNKNIPRSLFGPMEDLPGPTFWPIVTTVSSSPDGENILVCIDNTTYNLVTSNINNSDDVKTYYANIKARGRGLAAVFLGLDRFAVLTTKYSRTTTEEKILTVRTLADEIVSETLLPSDIHALSSYSKLEGYLLCKASDRVVMFDIQQRVVVSELSISSVHYIYWGVGDNGAVVIALVGDYFITVVDVNLKRLTTVNERNYRIESGGWDDENDGVFLYKNWNEIRYCLVNGESGTIMTYNEPLFITQVSGNTIYCVDEEGELRIVTVDATEYVIKCSIRNKDYMKQCACIRLPVC